MKTLLSLALLLCTLNGFAQMQSLEARVIEIAKADNTYYEPGTTTLVKTVSVQQSEENFFKDIDAEKIALAEALKETVKIIDQARKDNDLNTCRVWEFKKKRLEKLTKANKTDTDYIIYEHKYTTRNPDNSYSISKATSYYFFDGNNNFIGSVDSKTFDDCTVNFYKSDTQRYEAMMFEMKH